MQDPDLQTSRYCLVFMLEADRYHTYETNTDIFKKIFTDIWSVADIRLATNIDIPNFAYRYFNKVFWLKIVWIAYTVQTYGSLTK